MVRVTRARRDAFRAFQMHETSRPSRPWFEDFGHALDLEGLSADAKAWRALCYETDVHIFWESALSLSQRLNERRPDLGIILLKHIAEEAPNNLALRAKLQWKRLSGAGSFGSQVEYQFEHFSKQALDPAACLAIVLAGTTYRVSRLLALKQLGAGTPSRILASLLGFSVEVPVFTMGARLGQEWIHGTSPDKSILLPQELAASAIFLGSLRIAGIFNSQVPKSWRAPGTAATFLGIGVGHRLQIAAGLRAPRGPGEAWAEDIATLLQFHAAGSLSRGLTGKTFAQFEAMLDLRASQTQASPTSSRITEYGFAHSNFWPLAAEGEPSKTLSNLSLMVGKETTPPPERASQILLRYQRLFPQDQEGYYSSEILRTACRIPCGLPDFHERLVDAFLQSPNRGTKQQLYTALAIESVFTADAMHGSTGSFENGILQLLIGQTAAQEYRHSRLRSFQKIFLALERGMNRKALHDMMLELPYDPSWTPPSRAPYTAWFWQRHRNEVVEHWGAYRPKDADLLLNFIYGQSFGNTKLASQMIVTFGEGRRRGLYLSVDIEGVLDYARTHPLGNLVLRRLYNILAGQDIPGKLVEIATDPGSLDTVSRIETLRKHGVSPEKIAYELNGSEHTAYLNDLRLARKVVSVLQETGPYLKSPQLRDAGRHQIVDAFWNFAHSGRKLQAEDLMAMLRLHSNPATEAFTRAWLDGQVEIRITSRDAFDDFVERWGKIKGKIFALTVSRHGRQERDMILIPELPSFDLRHATGQDQAFHEFVNRARSLVHEAEHWRHSNGVFFGVEAASQALRLSGIGRQERLVSEIMAYLEEFRWRVRFSDSDFHELAQRLGVTLPTFLRNIADSGYFSSESRQLSDR